MRIKDEVSANGSFINRDGSTTRSREDKWVGNASLRERYPSLFNILERCSFTYYSGEGKHKSKTLKLILFFLFYENLGTIYRHGVVLWKR
jgi:hypothetical protein